MKNTMIRKNNLLSLIRKNKSFCCSLFVIVLVFVLLFDSFIVNASNTSYSDYPVEMGGTGSFTVKGDSIPEYFGMGSSYLYLNGQAMNSGYSGNVSNILIPPQGSLGVSTQQEFESDIKGFYDDWSTDYHFFIPDSVTAEGETITIDGGHYLASYSWNSSSSQKWVYSYKIANTSSNIAIVGGDDAYYIVSDAPFSFIAIASRAYDNEVTLLNCGSIDTPSGNGFYILQPFWQPVTVPITDLPIYLASSDSGSGYHYFDTGNQYNTTDFSFESDNFNFNHLLRNNDIVNPDSVSGSNARFYLDFKDSTFYGGDCLTSFYHNNDFNFNEYCLNNPQQFKIKFDYVITYKDNSLNTPKTFTYNSEIQLAYFLGQATRFGSGGRVSVPLSTNHFMSGSESLSSYLKQAVHSVQGTNVNTASPNNVVGLGEFLVNPALLFGWDESVKKNLPYVVQDFQSYVDVFTIQGKVTLQDIDNSNYESNPFIDSYNFLNGEYNIISTDNVNKPYTEENQPATDWVNTGVSNGGNNYGAGSVIQNANPTIIVNGSGGGLTQAYTLGETDIASLANTYQYILNTLGDTRSSNGFWALMTQCYDYIPEDIWKIILLGISTIIGISVVKVSLSLYRNKAG